MVWGGGGDELLSLAKKARHPRRFSQGCAKCRGSKRFTGTGEILRVIPSEARNLKAYRTVQQSLYQEPLFLSTILAHVSLTSMESTEKLALYAPTTESI